MSATGASPISAIVGIEEGRSSSERSSPTSQRKFGSHKANPRPRIAEVPSANEMPRLGEPRSELYMSRSETLNR